MPTRFTFKARTGGLQQCSLSVLAAILLAAAQATPVLAAGSAEQPARSLGNYRFSIAQQPLVSALNAFTAITGWQVGLPAELGQAVASPGVQEHCRRKQLWNACWSAPT